VVHGELDRIRTVHYYWHSEALKVAGLPIVILGAGDLVAGLAATPPPAPPGLLVQLAKLLAQAGHGRAGLFAASAQPGGLR
jgi:hypothetical protein